MKNKLLIGLKKFEMTIYYKNIITILFVALSLLACREENTTDNILKEIKVGKGDRSITEAIVSRGTVRNLVLSGGNGKYLVNVENSKFAEAHISNDTLKLKGLLEGETFATITSHNKKVRLGIRVTSPEITISHDQILLYPKAESRVISLSGGGDIVHLDIDDPQDIMKVKWNGNTGILEIDAFYEGEATITTKTEGQADKKFIVKVRSEGDIKEAGVYSTRNRYISASFDTKMLVKRKDVGIWLTGSSHPYGLVTPFYKRVALQIPFIKDPKQGTYVDVNVKITPYTENFEGINNGHNRLYIDEIKSEKSLVVLRGRGFRLALPYE